MNDDDVPEDVIAAFEAERANEARLEQEARAYNEQRRADLERTLAAARANIDAGQRRIDDNQRAVTEARAQAVGEPEPRRVSVDLGRIQAAGEVRADQELPVTNRSPVTAEETPLRETRDLDIQDTDYSPEAENDQTPLERAVDAGTHYAVAVECSNCGFADMIGIRRGHPVSTAVCPGCECISYLTRIEIEEETASEAREEYAARQLDTATEGPIDSWPTSDAVGRVLEDLIRREQRERENAGRDWRGQHPDTFRQSPGVWHGTQPPPQQWHSTPPATPNPYFGYSAHGYARPGDQHFGTASTTTPNNFGPPSPPGR